MSVDLRDVDQLALALVEAHGSIDAAMTALVELDRAIEHLAPGIAIARKATRTMRLVERVFHRCPDGYTSFLCAADTCQRCGWSPNVPVPDIEATARGLVAIYGEDAVMFAMALANVIEEELHGHHS